MLSLLGDSSRKLDIALRASGSLVRLMRIVAREAGHLAVLETGGHSQSIGSCSNLKPVVALVRYRIEVQLVFAQRLARPEGNTFLL